MTGTTPVVVVGGGIAGLVVARDLAADGVRVRLVEAAAHLGGCVAAHVVGGLALDAGAESFATRSPAVGALVRELALGDRVVTPAASGAWVHSARGTFPLPRTGLLGIPADLRTPELRAVLGHSGVARAALDRLLPRGAGLGAGRAGGPASLGRLVRVRQGRRVLERLVGPVVAGVHAADAERVDLDAVAPGLREAVLAHGSLARAVAALRERAPAGAAVASLDGGLHTLVTALEADLARLGVEVLLGARVTALHGPAPGEPPGRRARWQVALTMADGGPVTLAADDVVLAVPGPVAGGLLAVPGAVGGTTAVCLATLVLDAPELDAAPRGTGVLVAAGTPGVTAKALTHATAKWAWLARAAGPGRHVVRLSYGRHDDGGPPRPPTADLALADASTLLGVPIRADRLVALAVRDWPAGLPHVAPGHRAAAQAARVDVERRPGLWAAGAWVAGTGLAAVVADARALAARMLTTRMLTTHVLADQVPADPDRSQGVPGR